VSNFQVAHLQRLAEETDTVLAVNQIELHPCFQNGEVDVPRGHGIVTEAWSPIAQGTTRRLRRSGSDAEDSGASRTPPVHRARQDRLPQAGHAGPDQRELGLFDFHLEPGGAEKIVAQKAKRAAIVRTPTLRLKLSCPAEKMMANRHGPQSMSEDGGP
jgi:hypothetical protein